jgi:hypothetical protein
MEEMIDKFEDVLTSPKNPCKPNMYLNSAARVFWDCALKEAYVYLEADKYITFIGVSGLDEAIEYAKQCRGVESRG